jgi:hypothetical protein
MDEGILSIQYDLLGPYLGEQRMHNLAMNEEVSICYTPNKSILLEEVQTLYGLIEDLFILLTDSNYGLDWPQLSYETAKGDCQFYFSRQPSDATKPSWAECWTNFPQLRDNFGLIFSNWKNKRDLFGPGFYLYLGTRRSIKLYIEHRFVNLIWGIESLHRKKTQKSTIPSKLKQKINRILEQVNRRKDQEWLQNRLAHADEPSLEQRIFETFQNLPLELDEKSLRQFATDCARCRNDISHFGGQRKTLDYRAFVTDLHKKSNALSYLYHILLLEEIGVNKEILKYWVYEGYQSREIKNTLTDVGLLPKTNY